MPLVEGPDEDELGQCRERRARTLFTGYTGLTGCYDEIVDGDGQFRRDVRRFARMLDALGPREMERRQRLADGAFRQGGITFSVYSDSQGVEKIQYSKPS